MRGTYRAKAVSWDLGETDNKNEQIAVEFEILTPDAEMPRLTWYGFFTEKTWERTIESLRYMGWEGDDLGNLSALGTNEVDLVVDEEEYNGKVQTRVRWVNRPGGLNLKAPMSPERRVAFAAQMRSKIRGLEASKGQRAPAQRQAHPNAPGGRREEPPPHTELDIPF
jgi:hypothetical protein